ncbi:hypothetical protein PHPALM_30476 [Phytophthora palmivora]|uniref:Chromo domain-containing protein n=1 Tax=Phytophthora palmivora TaxID=4796 RepID=A0A2P4X501_9STRA|nr:hypothetical protein PHPALM_30476 [Phytophthora palmivora]
MSAVFECFRNRLGSLQRATLGYRPQANGQQGRSVQTVVRSIRADWDDHVEKLMFALNTSFDATRLETPFYLVHGWDAQNTISAMLGPKPASVPERSAYEWRRMMQRDYSYAVAFAEDLQKKAKRHRSEIQTQKWRELSDRLKSGFTEDWTQQKTGAPVAWALSDRYEVHEDFRVKLKVEGTGYRVNPWVHISRLKPHAALLPEDSWTPDAGNGEYEVEKILDLRWSKRTRTSKRSREYLVKWKGYDEPEWLPVSQLSCGALLYEFNQGARARARFQAMQAGDDHPRA